MGWTLTHAALQVLTGPQDLTMEDRAQLDDLLLKHYRLTHSEGKPDTEWKDKWFTRLFKSWGSDTAPEEPTLARRLMKDSAVTAGVLKVNPSIPTLRPFSKLNISISQRRLRQLYFSKTH